MSTEPDTYAPVALFYVSGSRGRSIECDQGCGFFRNAAPGTPCRRIGCTGTVIVRHWRSTEAPP